MRQTYPHCKVPTVFVYSRGSRLSGLLRLQVASIYYSAMPTMLIVYGLYICRYSSIYRMNLNLHKPYQVRLFTIRSATGFGTPTLSCPVHTTHGLELVCFCLCCNGERQGIQNRGERVHCPLGHLDALRRPSPLIGREGTHAGLFGRENTK